jgi:hydrogenase expression/formation protein HypC
MCLAVPVKVEQVLEDEQAIVELSGVKTRISLALVDAVEPGDYVILHVGYALSKLDPDEAAETLKLFAEGQSDPDEPRDSTV